MPRRPRRPGDWRSRSRTARPRSTRRMDVPFLHALRGRPGRGAQGHQTTPFFQAVRGHTVVALYNNKLSGPTSATRAAPTSSAATIRAASRTPAGRCSPTPRPAPRLSGLREDATMASFDLNDDCVVVIIGSGAGGGTLANELAQKGIKVVMLEAGGTRASTTSSMTNGRASSSWPGSTSAPPPATGGSRATSRTCPPGSARPSAAPRPTGPARRCASRSTSSKRARLRRDHRRQPARLADHAGGDGALLRPGRGQDGGHPHPRYSAACPATTISR